MIQTNELRIGNYVNLFLGVSDDGANYRQCQITGVKDDLGTIKIRLDQTDTWHHTGNFEPIPLTEELLLKCGFEIKETPNWQKYIQFGIVRIYIKSFSVYLEVNENFCQSFDVEINSLHQLQNIFFTLTNQELKIIL